MFVAPLTIFTCYRMIVSISCVRDISVTLKIVERRNPEEEGRQKGRKIKVSGEACVSIIRIICGLACRL